ncbi:hypothetical protein EDD63_10857 [Breznakia blatticola]|uniref:Zn-finger containing protein n=1 Tax=Breznakia blatticola TaxID=1754012 RepID=A0A4R8A2M5_9FIRM|nr:hypothetical protein [Breznakia blatticola]TDW24702.1 hypothetical protein EDD63_10857 [Breznakia blatticola]
MNKLKYKLYQFMQGRYGNDQLNTFLLAFAVVFNIVMALFVGSNWITATITWIPLIIFWFRFFSRKVYRRRIENNKFLGMWYKIRAPFRRTKRRFEDKSHKYYKCPKCKQVVRVPSGKGKIEITCPKCKTKFSKRT